MKVKDLLESKKFSYLKLLTPDVDLDRPIETIESTETPDVYKYISKNALVITTAMSFKENQSMLINFIDQLQAEEAAGLAIKVSRFLISLDQEVIDHCKKIGFPLLLIPANITLGTMYTEVLSELWEKEEDYLTFASNTQKVFSSLLLQKPTFSVILNTLKAIMKTEVGLIDLYGNIESCTNYFSPLFTKSQLRKVVKDKVHDTTLKYEETLKDTSGRSTTVFIHKINFGLSYPYFLFVVKSNKLDPKLCAFVTNQAVFALAFTISINLNDTQFRLQRIERAFTDFLQLAIEDKQDEMLKLTQKENLQVFERGRNVILHIPDFDKIFPYKLQEEGYSLIYNFLEAKLSLLHNYKLTPLIFDHYYLVQTDKEDLNVVARDMMRITNDLKEAIDAVFHGDQYRLSENVRVSQPHSYQKLFALIPDNQKQYFYESKLKKPGQGRRNL